jgi:hypothetical protein
MADAKRLHDWQLASTIVWITAEVNRDRKRRRRAFKPDDFNPMASAKPAAIKASVSQAAQLLGAAFTSSKDQSDRSDLTNPTDL